MTESNDLLKEKEPPRVKNPVKKVHCIYNKYFVIIDSGIAEISKINDEDTWFEQELIEQGILLKIHRFKEIES
jgi:hypothetical protein